MTLVTDHESSHLEHWAHRRLQRGRCAVFAGLLLASLMLPLEGLRERAAAQGPAFLVKDINTVDDSSNLSGLTNVNGTLFFVANDGSNGASLWKSDGTAAGTARIHPQLRADSLTNVNGTLFWNDIIGAQLWKSDGTEAGTTMVKDLSLTSRLGPFGLTDVNGTLFFVAIEGGAPGLWKSDGTEIGTRLVKEIHVETNRSTAANLHAPTLPVGTPQVRREGGGAPTSGAAAAVTVPCEDEHHPCCFLPCGAVLGLTNVGGALFFVAYDWGGKPALWKSNGTTDGTLQVTDLPFPPGGLMDVDGTLFFTGGDGNGRPSLWRSDGTEAGTTPIAAFTTTPSEPTIVNGTLFFFATDRPPSDPEGFQFSVELWKSDGTAAGTVRVTDLPFLYPADLTHVNGTLFFADSVESGGTKELWKSDGTEAGTAVVKEFSDELDHLTAVNGTLFFVADDGTGGSNLWRSDGTESGTVRVHDIDPSPYGAGPSELTNVNGTLFFTGDDGRTGADLWKSDGTEAGTTLVKDINRNTLSANPAELTDVNGSLFFLVNLELWKTDGSVGGTLPVSDFSAGGLWGLTNVNGQLLFSANQTESGQELWRSDGSAAGTVLLKDINPGPAAALESTEDMLIVGGTLFFAAYDGAHGVELWRSDGTEGGTMLVKDIYAGPPGSNPINLTNVNGTLFFGAYTGDRGSEFFSFELWKSDGTADGTVMVRSGYPNIRQQMADVDGTLFFAGDDGAGDMGSLWKSDGTEDGTVPVRNVGGPFALTSVNRTLYFLAESFGDFIDLWKSDGTAAGTVPLRRFAPGPSDLTNVDGTLFFFAADPPAAGGAAAVQLWKSNGTRASTVPVTDVSGFALAYNSFNAGNVANLNGTLLFFAQAADTGPGLWKSNGTSRTTLRIQDLAPSAHDQPASPFTVSGSNVFFAANDRHHGTELWALPLSALRAPCMGDCDGDGAVTIDELVQGVNLALGNSELSDCPAFDLDGSGLVTIDELIAGVGSAMRSCDGT